MSRKAQIARQIIGAYQGPGRMASRLAEFIGQGASGDFVEKLRARVYKWQQNGIASDWRGIVRKMCDAHGVEIPQDFDAPSNVPIPAVQQVLDSADVTTERRTHPTTAEGALP